MNAVTPPWLAGGRFIIAIAGGAADRGADNDVGYDAARDEDAHDADMGEAACRTAAERKPDGRAAVFQRAVLRVVDGARATEQRLQHDAIPSCRR